MLGGLKQNLMHTRTESSLDYKHISVPVSSKHISKELGLKEKKKKKKKKRGTIFSHCFPWNLCLAPYSTFPFRSVSDSQILSGMWASKLTLHSSPVSRPQALLLWNVFAFFHFLSFLLAPTLLRPLCLSSGLSQWSLNYCLCLERPPFPFLQTKFKMHLSETLFQVGWPFQWMSLASCHLKNKGLPS